MEPGKRVTWSTNVSGESNESIHSIWEELFDEHEDANSVIADEVHYLPTGPTLVNDRIVRFCTFPQFPSMQLLYRSLQYFLPYQSFPKLALFDFC